MDELFEGVLLITPEILIKGGYEHRPVSCKLYGDVYNKSFDGYSISFRHYYPPHVPYNSFEIRAFFKNNLEGIKDMEIVFYNKNKTLDNCEKMIAKMFRGVYQFLTKE